MLNMLLARERSNFMCCLIVICNLTTENTPKTTQFSPLTHLTNWCRGWGSCDLVSGIGLVD